jgi:ketosteroid isomerase-like protein
MAEASTRLSLDQKVQRVRDGFDAFRRGDMQAVSDTFAEDAVWHGSGSTKFGHDFKGKQAVIGTIVDYAQTFQDIKLDVHDVIVNDKHEIALVNSSVTRNGKTYQDHQVYIFHVNDDGKTTEAWIIQNTEQLKAALES